MVSPLCLGTMNFGAATDERTATAIVAKALGAGINFVDTADAYNDGQSEVVTGRAIRAVGNRDRLFVATKFSSPVGDDVNDKGVSRFHVMRACEDSLRRLDMDHVDLYQIHRPNFAVPPDETLRALDDLVRAGKVRYIGTTTHPAWRVMEGLAVSEKLGLCRYVSEQPPYNIADRRVENELIPLAQAQNLAIIPWSPLGGGLLSGKYPAGAAVPPDSRGATNTTVFLPRLAEKGKVVAQKLQDYAQKKGMSAAQLAYLWVKERPGVTAPIIGPRTVEQLDVALSIMNEALSSEDAQFIDSLVPPGTAVANFHNNSGWMKMSVL